MRNLRFVLVLVVALGAVAALWAFDANAPISQGDFAVLLASDLQAQPPAGGWNAASATAFLSQLQVTPMSGAWSTGDTLNEGDFAHILRLMGLSFYAVRPTDPVTWGKAIAELARLSDYLRSYPIAAHTLGQTTTTHVYTGIGTTDSGAPVPASPSKP